MSRKSRTYESRRDFSRTSEPRGGKRKPGRKPVFVIQKHDATTLHYDVRLEVGGTLKSWAVPKGPSTDPRDKRLATPTEDHPLDYADFEGVIPEGEYGAGAVIVWDAGPYDNITRRNDELVDAGQALENGHLLIYLHGKKLTGGYAFQRMGKDPDADWLLIKLKDDEADARRRPTSTEPRSVLSDRTTEEVAREASLASAATGVGRT